MAQTYNTTLTQLRNNVESIREVMNNNGMSGNSPMNTWSGQINTLASDNNKLKSQISTDDTQFNNIYNAIVTKGQQPDKDDRNTYPQAILDIASGDPELEKEVEELREQNTELTSKNTELTDKNTELTSKNTELTSKNTELTNENSELNTKNSELTSENNQLSYENSQLNNQNQNLTEQNTQLTNDNQSLTEQNNKLTNENNTLTSENSTLQKTNTKLEQQNESLEKDNASYKEKNLQLSGQVNEDNTNFDSIYDSIVAKNPSELPVKEERNTYANAIDSISSGAEIPEINYCVGLFGSGNETNNASLAYRKNLINILLPYCKNVTNWNHAFYGVKLKNGDSLDIDATQITSVDDAKIFDNLSADYESDEITITLNTNGIIANTFFGCGLQGNYVSGPINVIVKDISTKKITTLKNMFETARGIKSINIEADLSNVTDLSRMFYNFNNYNKNYFLYNIDLSTYNIDWSKVTSIQSMCEGSHIDSIDFGNKSLQKTNTSRAFYNCQYLKNINIRIFDDDFNNKTGYTKASMFYYCTKLEEINSLEWQIQGSTEAMFSNCNKLTKLPKIIKYLVNTNANTMDSMFKACYALEEIEIEIEDGMFIPSNVGYLFSVASMFQNCDKLRNIKGNFDLTYVNNTNYIFYECTSLETIEISGSFAGSSDNSTRNLTLDLSASPVFNAEKFITDLDNNKSGQTRTIKLNSTVFNNLSEDIKQLATSKYYTLSS